MDTASGVGIPLAVLAGLVSFLSPCVLPLVPGYLSAVAGVAPDQIERAGARRVVGPSLLFVAAFSAIFVLLGLASTKIGQTLHDPVTVKISGVLIIVMGVFFLLTPWVARLNREWHVDGLVRRAGRGGPIVAGAAFAIAWTPCVGPTLGAILSAAASAHSAGRGAVLLGFYSAGLAVPFLATSIAFGRMTTAFAAVKRHYAAVITVGGVVLIAMGVLILTGGFFELNIQAQRLLDQLNLNVSNDL